MSVVSTGFFGGGAQQGLRVAHSLFGSSSLEPEGAQDGASPRSPRALARVRPLDGLAAIRAAPAPPPGGRRRGDVYAPAEDMGQA
eukprot:370641-Pyramimonas_sp.AAC.1